MAAVWHKPTCEFMIRLESHAAPCRSLWMMTHLDMLPRVLVSSTLILAFICFPFSPSINSLTSLAISSLLTSPDNSRPISHLLQALVQFVLCSPKNGQQIMGTPADTLSMIEFHPLCVKNPPIDKWLNRLLWAPAGKYTPSFCFFDELSG